MFLVAWGDTGLGALIWETDRGRPLGMSRESEERSLEEDLEDDLEELLLLDLDEDLEEEDLEEDLDEDLEEDLEEDLRDSEATSRMFSSRPVVGSTVESQLGLWATW
jgi:hypothetical protein